MSSEDIVTAVKDSIDVAMFSPAPNGAPLSEMARQDNSKGSKEGVRVLFQDEEEFKRKRERMVADGVHQLQVIAGSLLQVVFATELRSQSPIVL